VSAEARRRRAAGLASAAVVAALLVWHCWRTRYDHDEVEHLHAAWLLSIGRRPFVDFFEQHHPTLWLLLSPLAARIASPQRLIFTARLLDLACLMGVLGAIARLSRRLFPTVSAAWPLWLLGASFMFVRKSIEVRPDPLMNLFVYLALVQWIGFLVDPRRRRAAAAGIGFGAAIVVLQKALVVFGLWCLASLWLIVFAERARRRDLLVGVALAAAAAAVPVLALFGWVAARDGWSDFWLWNYSFNRFFYFQAQLDNHFSVLPVLGLSVVEDVALWGLGVAGWGLIAAALWRRRRAAGPRDQALFTLCVVGAGYFLFLARNRFPNEQYLIVPLPLLALFATEVFRRQADGRLGAWLRALSLSMGVVQVIALTLTSGNAHQRRVQDYLLAHTNREQTVFAPPSFNPIFRRDSAFFWYGASFIGAAYAQYCNRGGACARDQLLVDEAIWSRAPPVFVYLDRPEYYPVHWRVHADGFSPTEIPKLVRNRALHP
jgi:hypothetical protein